MSFTKVAPVGIGTEPGSSIRIGDSLLHSTGIDLGTGTGVGVTIRQHGDATFTGVVTASSFSGNIGGNPTFSGDATFNGNVSIGGTLTYEDVTSVDSIGIITARSSINVNNAAGSGIGVTINSGGINVAGVITATSFSGIDSDKISEGNTEAEVVDTGSDGHFKVTTEGTERVRIDANGRLLYGQTSAYSVNPAGGEIIGVFAKDQANRSDLIVSNQSNANNAGASVVLASHGQDYIVESTGSGNSTDGAGALIVSKTGEERLRINSNGSVDVVGKLSAKSVGLGTTTTTGRNAGVSTSTGELIFNATEGTLQVYNGNRWDSCSNVFSATGGNTTYTQGNYKVHVFTSNGTFVANASGNVDALVVGGGGGGGATSRPSWNGAWAGGGGAGGVNYQPEHPLSAATYPVVIGSGGGVGSNGSDSTFDTITGVGGGRGGGSPYPGPTNGGAAGGSGGGGLGDHSPAPSRAGGAGTSGQGNTGGDGIDPGGGPDNYEQGGGGGGAGEAGNTDGNGWGGDGRDMSSEFGTTYGESGVFGGGGAGGAGTSGGSYNEGGTGGGGDSGYGHNNNGKASTAGATNTGGGGGAGGNQSGGGGQPGGPGIVLIRYLVN